MNILLIHRQEENPDYINYGLKVFSRLGETSSMKNDQDLYMTNDRSSWLRDCATGYSIYGEPRYEVFVILGRRLDSVIIELLSMIDNKPVYYVAEQKMKKLLPEQVDLENMEIKE